MSNRYTEEKRGGSRELALIGLGVLAALCVGLVRSSRAAQPASFDPVPRVSYWAADRDGDHVFGLDAELLLRTKKRVQRPLRVAGRVDGGAWILHAMGSRTEPHGLLRIDEWGVTQAATSLAESLDLVTWRGRDALVIERGTGAGGVDRVLRFAAGGRETRLFEGPGLRCLGVQGERLLVGDAQGGVTVLLPDKGEARPRVVPCGEAAVASLVAVSATDRDAGWWLLLDDFAGTLARLGPDLRPLWSTATRVNASGLVASLTGDGVWLADETRPVVCRYGERGRLRFQRDVSLAGLARGVALAEGGVLFTAPGALLRFDEHGQAQPGQGGFQFLVDVTAVPARAEPDG